MPGLLNRKPNRRRDPARPRNRFRPWLEELESRTAFAVSGAGLLGALPVLTSAPAATTPTQVAIVSAPTAAPAQPGLPGAPPSVTNLSQPLAAPPGNFFAQPVAAQALTLSPESLPVGSTAPLSVLSYADYQLTSGLNPSLAAGQLPTLLNTPAVNALFEVGGSASGAFTPAPAGASNSAVVPANAVIPANAVVPGNVLPRDIGPAPADDGQTEQGPMSSLHLRGPARPDDDYPDTQAVNSAG
jgi:hypothetical protein